MSNNFFVQKDNRGTAVGNILIVGHVGVNRVLLCYLIDIPLSNLFRLWQDFGGLNVIKYGDDLVRVHSMNMVPGVLRDYRGEQY